MIHRLVRNGIGLLLASFPLFAAAQTDASASANASAPNAEILAKQKKLNAKLQAKSKQGGNTSARIPEDGIDGPFTKAAEKAVDAE